MRQTSLYRLLAILVSGYFSLTADTVRASTPRLTFTPPTTQDQLSNSPSNNNAARLSKPLFLTGIVAGSVGAASALTFGILSFTQSKKLESGISTGIDHSSYDRIAKKGTTYNSLTVTGAILTGIGYATAIVVYAIDYNRCGALAQRSRRCQNLQNSNARWRWQPTGFRF